MSGASQIIDRSGCLIVQGNLDFDTVMKLWQQSLPFFAKANQLIFDLSEVLNSNSAGLALIVEWKKLAIKKSKVVEFKNLPAQLSLMIDTAGMKDLLL